MKSLLSAATALSILLELAPACGPSTSAANSGTVPGPDSSCVAGTAQIGVGDGFQEVLCGCQEAAGQAIPAGSAAGLTCTMPVGTQVFFYYIATRLRHQIAPTDGVSFPAGPVSDPSATIKYRVYTFKLGAAGSYKYLDLYDAGVTGTLIAQ